MTADEVNQLSRALGRVEMDTRVTAPWDSTGWQVK